MKLEEIRAGNCGVLLYATRAEKNNRPVLSLHHFSMEDQLSSLCLEKLDTNNTANKLELDLEEYRNLHFFIAKWKVQNNKDSLVGVTR